MFIHKLRISSRFSSPVISQCCSSFNSISHNKISKK